MEILKNKTKITTIALVLVLTIAAIAAIMPAYADLITVTADRYTFAYDPIGVNQLQTVGIVISPALTYLESVQVEELLYDASFTFIKPDGTKEKTTFYGTFGSFIAAVSNVSELLTSAPGDNYIAVDLVGEDIQGVPLFLWREKAVNERYIRPHTGKLMIFRSVLIKHDDYNASGYRLTAAGKYFGVEPYEKGE